MINVSKIFDIENNFWDQNPHMKILEPFSRLFKRDKSKNATNSSKEMWCIFLYQDPHPSKNPLYNLPPEDRKEQIKDGFYPIDWEDKDIKVCMEAWTEKCLTDVERNFKGWRDKLVERDKFLACQPYDLDNGDALDRMLSNTKKLWDAYKSARDEMLQEENKLVGKGQRKMTVSEKAVL
jgi:hypothetical protein